jgi:alpha-glucan,water dikinase
MKNRGKIISQSGLVLLIEKSTLADTVEVVIRMETHKNCLLHWGLRRNSSALWQIPPRSVWPEGSQAFAQVAVQTPFLRQDGEGRIMIKLERPIDFRLIDFVLFFPEERRWDNNGGQNYHIEIPRQDRLTLPFSELLTKDIGKGETLYEHMFHVDDEYQLSVALSKDKDGFYVVLMTDLPGTLILHWGVANRFRYEWFLPSPSICPEGTTIYEDRSAQTPFREHEGFREVRLNMREQEAPMGISFVLKQVETGRWIKEHGRNFYIPVNVALRYEVPLCDPLLMDLANEIIKKEMSRNSWTLMHRFNLCYDLLDRIKKNNLEGLALIFVWLRFSALRQLDWQRNYNTKPRELGHSMDRLTIKLADRYTKVPRERELVRLIMTTLGRGSDAQRVRDEILNIMHRHRIKEVSGHFMEEWHQKLHNNATPDDIVICEAYLEFLKSDGNLDRFYERLEEGGVTKNRLESYERPIKSHPDFIPYLKEALIQEFEHFLVTLKEVHSGTDLGTAIHTTQHLFDSEINSLMDFIWSHRDDQKMPVCTLVEKITQCRQRLAKQFKVGQKNLRDLLFLDIALEDFLRTVVEQNPDSHLSDNELVDLTSMVLENLCLSYPDEELRYSLKHWKHLEAMPHFEKEWVLWADAVLDRLEHALGSFIDRYIQLLQPRAEYLGAAFHADPWVISLFTDEVVRGRPVFILSMLLRNLHPLLRKSADIGNWQLISRGRGIGQVEVVDALKSIQGKSLVRPTVIVADSIGGDEEIPQGVVAIITPVIIDSLSHLAIRARNAGILFATCYDPELIGRMKSLRGHMLKLSVSATGEVVSEESREDIGIIPRRTIPVRAPISRPGFTVYALSMNDFTERNVGYKSSNLRRIKGKLPEWIVLPPSVALPFGVFEKVLAEENNKGVAERYRELTQWIDEGKKETEEILAKLRKTILDLKATDKLTSSIYKIMEKSELSRPLNWEETWTCIKRVWSSKWNERAYLSRRANGISDDNLVMSVLIQRVVEADYSFVIHTINPFTLDRGEVYAEVVLGLGETLAGNYPGKALSFTCRKGKQEIKLLSFPSKSVGVFGTGLIFRSDSNGEDLAGYAGAGLYDSFMLPPPHQVPLDYTADLLARDNRFRSDLLITIANIGAVIENVLGTPQDIEGAYSRGQYYVVQTRPQVGIEN